ncbi:Rod shape-determining protein MreD [Limibacter armeniacum]|uniref:Rod shape-determining protein MreD n=1 Tax=Limibacter armeniacum TaxID=466084 RepID=UPI002FE6798B
MGNTAIAKLVVRFFLYVLLQGVLLRNASLFDYALCYPYVSYLILLPFSFSPLGSLLLGFALGISVDIFYDTLGIHAAACVLMAFARIQLLNVLSPSGGFEANMSPTIASMGFNWFVSFSAALIAIHHISLFLIDASNMSKVGGALLQSLASGAFTLVMVVAIQYLFFPSKRKLF